MAKKPKPAPVFDEAFGEIVDRVQEKRTEDLAAAKGKPAVASPAVPALFADEPGDGGAAPVIQTEPTVSVAIVRRVPNGAERSIMADRLRNQLLEAGNAIEGVVSLKAAEEIVKEARELLKDKAILGMTEKKETWLGADVSTRRDAEWDYHNDLELHKLEGDKANLKAQMDEIDKQIKDRMAFLQKLKSEMADTATGEITVPATLIRDGLNIAVSLPK